MILVIDGNAPLSGSLPHLTQWDIIWFYATPSFMVMGAVRPAVMEHAPYTTMRREACHKKLISKSSNFMFANTDFATVVVMA